MYLELLEIMVVVPLIFVILFGLPISVVAGCKTLPLVDCTHYEILQ